MASSGLKERFSNVGVGLHHVLVPADGIDTSRFAVIACDQFSTDPSYWDGVEKLVGTAPSAFRLILPEARLKTETEQEPKKIAQRMQSYLDAGVLADIGECLVFVQRATSTGVRRGLVMALDLEQFDYRPGAKGLIRATEATVTERLPARIEIRRQAPLELPHIMALIDDQGDALMGALEASLPELKQIYDFELMQGGGRITGYQVADEVLLAMVAEELEYLMSKSSGMLYAIGDGNHAFAAARACWEERRQTLTPEQQKNDPARYCLCEIVNIYDPALAFEPIHRALLNVDPAAVQREIGFDANCPPPLERLQSMLDQWLANHPEAELEYIHGEAECRALCNAPDRLAIILPEFDKRLLFDLVRRFGALTRKSFSLGSARDKRYYLEARRIK